MKLVNKEINVVVSAYEISIRTSLQMSKDNGVYDQVLTQLVFPLEDLLQDNQRWYVKRTRQV